jgi:hypothetical protein
MRLAVITLALLTTACLSRQLQPHTAKHASETQAVCAACEHECSEPIRWDVCETARQACKLDALAHSRDGSECERGEP